VTAGASYSMEIKRRCSCPRRAGQQALWHFPTRNKQSSPMTYWSEASNPWRSGRPNILCFGLPDATNKMLMLLRGTVSLGRKYSQSLAPFRMCSDGPTRISRHSKG